MAILAGDEMPVERMLHRKLEQTLPQNGLGEVYELRANRERVVFCVLDGKMGMVNETWRI